MALTWAWRGAIAVTEAATQLTAVLKERGYGPSVGKKSNLKVSLYPDGKGGTLLMSWGANGLGLAQAMSRATELEGLYCEVALTEKDVKAVARVIASDGTSKREDDHGAAAAKLCDEWYEGKKYRPEAADDLAAIFVELEDGCPDDDTSVDLAFDRTPGSARVQSLVDAVRAGAQWEKTEMGGRLAIRIKDGSGTRISVLDDAELATFEREIA
jgi:hypothetical protein